MLRIYTTHRVAQLLPRPVLEKVPDRTRVQRAEHLHIRSMRGEHANLRELGLNGGDRIDAAHVSHLEIHEHGDPCDLQPENAQRVRR